MKYNLKRSDEVVIITGAEKGKRGKVLEVLREKDRVIVEGIAMRKRTIKKSEQNPEGGFEEREASIHYSNVMAAKKYDARKAK